MKSRMNVERFCCVSGAIAGLWANGFAQGVDFGGAIWPIIESRCIECHGPEKQKEGLRFDDLEWLSDVELLGDGDSSKSLIYEMVTLEDDEDGYMPKKRERLSADELDVLRRWLDEGADSEGWVVPEVIVVRKDRDAHLESLAEGVEVAPESAVDALRALGVVVVPLGQNSNLLRVDFDRADENFEDRHLELLLPLSGHVTILSLANTEVSDSGLSKLDSFSKLTQLNLGGTAVGDEGLKHLDSLEHLEVLNVIRSQVTDAGLESLEELGYLRNVYAWGSQVTREGAERLKAEIPGLRVNLGIE